MEEAVLEQSGTYLAPNFVVSRFFFCYLDEYIALLFSCFSCVYRFEAQKDEKVKLVLNHMVVKGRKCKTRLDPFAERLQCFGNTTATLRFYDVPWNDVPPVPRDCLCGGDDGNHLPFTYISTSNIVEVRFDVTNMNATDDYNSLFFSGTWKFIKTPSCGKDLKLSGPSGEINYDHPAERPKDVRTHFI